ncbi:hypothetical protein D8Y22_07170 [Salinadaptatus halalkaliphilus]|uniref:DUF7344 domain-containing protein n=1 Tax=Salinadaptatus halalkaliphilus TaxID=2419781 RepID=A0A4V3VLH9_9EURY|nr:hypothetical protein [Salinadaptatus halalkaliphilus]THE65587.1 hypothetical protein D8Y22_07170 [Salinadaptatus halalkaliphilus]
MGRLQPTASDQSVSDSHSNAHAENRLADPSSDGPFEILSSPRRRHVIEFLASSSEDAVRLRDLAEQIAAWENDISRQEITYKQRKRVYTSLYQTHLPKMDRAGVIDYDRHAGIVRSTAEVSTLRAYLELTPATPSRNWGTVGLVGSVLSIVFVSAASFGVGSADGATGYVIAFIVSTLFLLVSIGQYCATDS